MVNFKNNFYIGNKIIYLNEPHIIEHVEFIKPGKGKSFIRTKMRNLINFKMIIKTFKYINSIREASVINELYNYVYNDNSNWYFFNNKNFDLIEINYKILKNNIKFICNNNNKYNIYFWNKIPIFLVPPKILVIKVLYLKDNEIFNSNLSKFNLAVLETGLVIKVPGFVKKNDFIKINTLNKLYVNRL